MEKIRINKYIASAGVAARRKADEMIDEGRVYINDKVARQGDLIDPDRDIVKVDENIIGEQEEKVYYVLNKPAKVICAVTSEDDRQNVVELINDKRRIFPIGRLDYDTEGLLLLTNDGELYNRVIHPKAEIFKSYFVKIKGRVEKKSIQDLRYGVNLEDGITLPARVELITAGEKQSEVFIAIREGRNRQVRRMFEKVGHEVINLKRTAIGEMMLGELSTGEYRELTNEELNYLKNL
jgi:23S rRNA pseudouridine2605 synthase